MGIPAQVNETALLNIDRHRKSGSHIDRIVPIAKKHLELLVESPWIVVTEGDNLLHRHCGCVLRYGFRAVGGWSHTEDLGS
jgi:hypothetical protein